MKSGSSTPTPVRPTLRRDRRRDLTARRDCAAAGYTGWQEPGGRPKSGVQLLTLRRHGFVSYRAGDEVGVFLSKPLRLPACAGDLLLTLNVETSVDGYAAVELREGLNASAVVATARRFVGNDVALPVEWQSNATASSAALPSALHGRVVRLRIELLLADLYAFQFDCG